jgi:hypothetical protein
MTDTERELDLALGEAQAEIAKLQAAKDQLYALLGDMATRLIRIRELASVSQLIVEERLAGDLADRIAQIGVMADMSTLTGT